MTTIANTNASTLRHRVTRAAGFKLFCPFFPSAKPLALVFGLSSDAKRYQWWECWLQFNDYHTNTLSQADIGLLLRPAFSPYSGAGMSSDNQIVS
jgi:hypothetical protein